MPNRQIAKRYLPSWQTLDTIVVVVVVVVAVCRSRVKLLRAVGVGIVSRLVADAAPNLIFVQQSLTKQPTRSVPASSSGNVRQKTPIPRSYRANRS